MVYCFFNSFMVVCGGLLFLIVSWWFVVVYCFFNSFMVVCETSVEILFYST